MKDDKYKISVLMSVYNSNWKYLQEALDSISKQSYKNFEVVIVNDGGDSGRLRGVLEHYNFDYNVIENEINLGLPRALNKGLKECKGEYIARFDDDDIMESERLNIQLRYMEENPQFIAIFSNYSRIDKKGNIFVTDNKDHNKELKRQLIYKGNCLCHSTLFIRKEVLLELGGYDEKMTYSQDYDLYMRMIKKGKIYEIPKMLVRLRSDRERISKNKQLLSALFAYYATLKYLSEDFRNRIFWNRTLRTVLGVWKILKE